jgi:hypothetical protein
MKTLLLGIIVAVVFISTNSFWIDEGNAAYKASQSTLSAWWHSMHSVTGSDSQMPIYMLYIWCWEKIVPSSEFWLRMSNLPWFLLILYSLRPFRFGLLCALTCPFLIGYMNELRPYVMQLAGAALSIRSLSNLHLKESKSWMHILIGCLIMCMASLIGVVWAFGPLIYTLIERPKRFIEPWFWKSTILAAPFYLLLAYYYVWTLLQGQEAAMMGGGIIVSAGAAAYELLGLAGLGPSKITLRTNPGSVVEYLPLLIPAVLISTGLISVGFHYFRKHASKQQLIAATCAVSAPCLILISLVLFKDFRLLGRHLAPLSVVIVLLIAIAMNQLWNASTKLSPLPISSKIKNSICVLTIVLGILSSLSLRFNPIHRKDDYREAVRIAQSAIDQQRRVYWAADKWTAFYYGLSQGQQGWQEWRDGLPIPELSPSDLVIISKPDIYDKNGIFYDLLQENGFSITSKLQAFTVYQK